MTNIMKARQEKTGLAQSIIHTTHFLPARPSFWECVPISPVLRLPIQPVQAQVKFWLGTDAAKSFTQQILSVQQQQQQSLFVLLPYVKFIAKILEIKFEYWLPGITEGASGTRQPSALNENKLQVSKIAQIHTHTRDTHKDSESNAMDITTRNYYVIIPFFWYT